MIESKEKRKGQVESKRRSICRGAMKVLQRKKFHAASMREIAEATGMSLGNLYHYIEKKEDILVLIYQDLLDQIHSLFGEALRRHDDPVEQLVQVITALFNLACRMKREALVILTEARSLGRRDLHDLLRQESRIVSAIETIIQRGVERSRFRCSSPRLAANVIAYNVWIIPLRGWNILSGHKEKDVLDYILRCYLQDLGVRSVKFSKAK